MGWRERRRSSNVDDRRGRGGIGGFGGGRRGTRRGGGLGGPLLGLGGFGGLILFLLLNFLGSGGGFLNPAPQQSPNSVLPPQEQYAYESATEEELFDYVSVILADTEDIWDEIFQEYGYNYSYPELVVYTGVVQSACGVNSAQTGSFYCPVDQKLYIDLSFYDELRYRF